jgi:DNA-binding transcriptional regulator YdaS (Cro superfamily)
MDLLKKWLDDVRGRRKILAKRLEISPGALSQWSRVPASRVLDVELATGLSRFDLRPDIYGPRQSQHKSGPAASPSSAGGAQ